MKLVKARTHLVLLPADEPIVSAPVDLSAPRPVVAIELETDTGIEGLGITMLGAGLSRALHAAVAEMAGMIIGMDAQAIDPVRQRIVAAAGGTGPDGIFSMALSAIDIALWDIRCKALGVPVWKYLGASGAPMPAYASGVLKRELSQADLLKAAERLVALGYRQMKMQFAIPGNADPLAEAERARALRAHVGPDIALMADINQRWSVSHALAVGRLVEDLNFAWLEDVTVHDDFAGLAHVAHHLVTPCAAGEYLYGLPSFRRLIESRAADIVMIDPFRVGGIGPWLKIAHMAEAAGLPAVSHLAPEIQLHLLGAVPNGMTLEFFPQTHLLYRDMPWPENGMMAMPRKPGLGLELDRGILTKYGVAA